MGPPKWKETNIGDTPIFHWTMIMGGRVEQWKQNPNMTFHEILIGSWWDPCSGMWNNPCIKLGSISSPHMQQIISGFWWLLTCFFFKSLRTKNGIVPSVWNLYPDTQLVYGVSDYKKSGQISSRPHTTKNPKWRCKFSKGNPRKFQGNLGEGEILWISGQIITTSAEVTLNGGLIRELPQNPLNSGLGIILICPVLWTIWPEKNWVL